MPDTETRQEKIAKVKEFLGKGRISSAVVESTLGMKSDNLTPHILLRAAGKLLGIHKGTEEPDDRDNLKYSDFLGLEDYISEHIDKDAGKLLRKAKMRMDQKKNLSWLSSGYFTPQIKSTLVGNALSQNMEGINPFEFYDTSGRVTKLGEGGISGEAIPQESRQVSPSSFGLFDPVKNMESTAIGVTNYFARNVVKGKDRKLYKLLQDKNGKKVWVAHDKMLNSKIRIPEY